VILNEFVIHSLAPSERHAVEQHLVNGESHSGWQSSLRPAIAQMGYARSGCDGDRGSAPSGDTLT
jgi:hypothetical protein